MKRVKEKQAGVRRSLLLAGLAMASVSAQAGTITAGNGIPDYSGGAGSTGIQNPGVRVALRDLDVRVELRNPGARLELQDPYAVIQPPAAFLSTPSASASVSGSMNYSVGTSSGNFNEYDSSPDGSMVALEMKRKGYGYQAEASAETGLAMARVATQWVPSSGSNYGYGNASAGAKSNWSDWFVISGGTGLGTASFASELNGMMASGKNGSASYSLNIGYSTGAYCYGWYYSCGEADLDQTLFSQTFGLSGRSKTTLSQDVEGEFTFAYDKPFQLTATLNVNAGHGGMADFTLISLSDSLALPVGSQLLSSSGLYVQAVPEAETYAMMLAGLGLVGWAARRRRTIPK